MHLSVANGIHDIENPSVPLVVTTSLRSCITAKERQDSE